MRQWRKEVVPHDGSKLAFNARVCELVSVTCSKLAPADAWHGGQTATFYEWKGSPTQLVMTAAMATLSLIPAPASLRQLHRRARTEVLDAMLQRLRDLVHGRPRHACGRVLEQVREQIATNGIGSNFCTKEPLPGPRTSLSHYEGKHLQGGAPEINVSAAAPHLSWPAPGPPRPLLALTAIVPTTNANTPCPCHLPLNVATP